MSRRPRQAREVRQVGGVRLGQAIRVTLHLHFTHRQGFHFSPQATHQRHHGTVGAQVLDRGSCWRRWPLAL
jgi:hypothetical protein